jgi:hypothetical protein
MHRLIQNIQTFKAKKREKKHPLMKGKSESSVMHVTAKYSGKFGFRGGKRLRVQKQNRNLFS